MQRHLFFKRRCVKCVLFVDEKKIHETLMSFNTNTMARSKVSVFRVVAGKTKAFSIPS